MIKNLKNSNQVKKKTSQQIEMEEEKLREHIFEIASIKEGFINNDKDYLNQNEAADSKFNYGREVIKNSREETDQLPYSKIKLFSNSGK